MNNLRSRDKTVPGLVDMVALVKQALANGRLKVLPDGLLLVDGVPVPQVSAASGSSARADKKLVNKFLFTGTTWTLEYDGVMVEEQDWLGMHYIMHLLQHPHENVKATKLVIEAYGEPVDIMKAKDLLESGVAVLDDGVDEISGEEKQNVVTTEFRDEILPDEDRARVVGILEKAEEQLDVLKAGGLVHLIPDKEWEIEEIKKYLKKTRFGCANAYFATRAEKDRKAVAKAIGEAIDKIAKQHAALAEHLEDSIETGGSCSYQPDVDVYWEVAEKWRPVAPSK
jgi:hypothetical protein